MNVVHLPTRDSVLDAPVGVGQNCVACREMQEATEWVALQIQRGRKFPEEALCCGGLCFIPQKKTGAFLRPEDTNLRNRKASMKPLYPASGRSASTKCADLSPQSTADELHRGPQGSAGDSVCTNTWRHAMSADFTLPADAVVPFPYVKWSPVDWIEGTESFQLELEGAYCRFMNRLYKRGRAFVDDDRAMAKHMELSLRVWKRLKDVLVGKNKIIIVNGCLTNARFERERLERASMLRKQSEAASATHESRRLKNASLVKFEQSLAKTSPKVGPNFSETKSENPVESTVCHLSEHGHLKSKSQKEEEKENPPLIPPSGEEAKQPSLFPEPARIGRVAAAVAVGFMASALPAAAELPAQPAVEQVQAESAPVEKSKRMYRMPAGWRPSESTMAWAKKSPVLATDEQTEQQFLAFSDYHLSKGSKFIDWDRAFQTWMRNARDYGKLKTMPAAPARPQPDYMRHYEGVL